MLRSLICLTALIWLCGASFAQTKADRKDEQHENARVSNAKRDLQQAQRALDALIKEYRDLNSAVLQTEKKLHPAQLNYSNAREAAEERLEESSGLPQLIRKMRGFRDQIALLSTPILAELHQTEQWQAAVKRSAEAQQARANLLDDDSIADGALKERLAELDKLIAAPESLALSTTDADPKIKQLRSDYQSSLLEIATVRQRTDASKIDADPTVRTAKIAIEHFQRDALEKRGARAVLSAKVSKQRSAIVTATRKLQQALTADRMDSNQSKGKKK